MKPGLQQLCESFLENKTTVKSAFGSEHSSVYPVCSCIFLGHKKTADEQKLKECESIIRENAKLIGGFGGTMKAPAASFLACSDDPENEIKPAVDNYGILRKYYEDSDCLVFSSLVLTALVPSGSPEETVKRGKALHESMKEKNLFTSGCGDVTFATLLAFSEKSDADIIGEIEECVSELESLTDKNTARTLAQILAISKMPVGEKCERFRALLESIIAAGIKYGKSHELPVLAALAVSDEDVIELVSDIYYVYDYLAEQEGYKGFFGSDKKHRATHSAMIVSSYYMPSIEGAAAAISSMLSAISVQLAAMTTVSH